jgi:hypothetical protein
MRVLVLIAFVALVVASPLLAAVAVLAYFAGKVSR